MDIQEITLDTKPNKMEEIFSSLNIAGLPFRFLISKEENIDAKWTYRIYASNEQDYRLIEPLEFKRIRQLMQDVELSDNEICYQSKIQKLMNIWKEKWLTNTPHGRNENKGGFVV